MKQELLMDFLQISETLKLGKKHHKNKKHKSEKEDKLKHEGKKKGQRKMSFATRTTLLLLLKHESLNQRNIAKIMNISSQAVSEIIKKLLEKELINKESGELNNENIISLTEEGKVVAIKTENKMNVLSENIFKDFTNEEIENFSYLLSRIKKNKEELLDLEDDKDDTQKIE